MKILVIGSGGREHAICWALRKSERAPQIFCAPGNAGICAIAECVEIAAADIEKLADFAEEKQIDLTFVGGEISLALGVVDEFERRGLRIVGASRNAARLESSKIFAKDFMSRHNIPTANYTAANSAQEALYILQSGEMGDENQPVVVKADGLAAGKGVCVAKDRESAMRAIREMSDGIGEAARRIVLEETLTGREVSLLLFADGENFRLMPPVRDHKRIGENDEGANTGGMGTVTDANLLNDRQLQLIVKTMVEPTLRGAAAEGFKFCGVLFLGLMMTNAGAKLLEYNVRFGDPEAQAILVRLKTDLVEICEAIIEQKIGETAVEFSDEASACVVLASRGYPQRAETGDRIRGLERAAAHENVTIFHAGTAFDANRDFVTSGGRVLGVTAIGADLETALQRSYAAVAEIGWNGMQFRRDIGKSDKV